MKERERENDKALILKLQKGKWQDGHHYTGTQLIHGISNPKNKY